MRTALLLVLAALFVVVLGFWAFDDNARPCQPQDWGVDGYTVRCGPRGIE